MRQRELYTLSKRIRKINRAEQELWMRGFVIYPLIIGLSCIDGVTLYEVFFKMTESAEKEAVYLLTVGVAIILNFIPLVVGRYIHYHRYGMNGVKLWMIVGLIIVFFLLFFTTFYLRWETRGMDGKHKHSIRRIVHPWKQKLNWKQKLHLLWLWGSFLW